MNGCGAAPEVGKSIINHAIVTASVDADGKPVPFTDITEVDVWTDIVVDFRNLMLKTLLSK